MAEYIDGEIPLPELPPSEVTAARIVELSKKNRALNLALEREKTNVSNLKKEIAALREFAAQGDGGAGGEAAVAGTSGRAASAGSAAGKDREKDAAPEKDPAAEGAEWKEKALALHARAERDGNKIATMKIENEKLRQILKRELGDDGSVDKALSATGAAVGSAANAAWRGRAQQIIALKEKVKELTDQLAQLGGAAEKPVDPMTLRVQKKKIEEIEETRRERIAALEAELATTKQEAAALKTKSDAQASRITGLEKDIRMTNERVNVLLEKSGKDDKLVDALKKALEQAREIAAGKARMAAVNPTAAGEIASLRAKVTGLQQQVGRQEHIIRELYKKAGGAAIAELADGPEDADVVMTGTTNIGKRDSVGGGAAPYGGGSSSDDD